MSIDHDITVWGVGSLLSMAEKVITAQPRTAATLANTTFKMYEPDFLSSIHEFRFKHIQSYTQCRNHQKTSASPSWVPEWAV